MEAGGCHVTTDECVREMYDHSRRSLAVVCTWFSSNLSSTKEIFDIPEFLGGPLMRS